MSAVKFVDDLPDPTPRGPKRNHALYAELRANPGRWAEVARYSPERKSSASSRGQALANRHSDLEYTTRTVDGETVLYLRAMAS